MMVAQVGRASVRAGIIIITLATRRPSRYHLTPTARPELRLIPSQEWQTDHWDTRLRSGESYDAKWEYVRNNPVRAGLVKTADEWPYQGELNVLPW
jgi:hypothetical protein